MGPTGLSLLYYSLAKIVAQGQGRDQVNPLQVPGLRPVGL